MPRTGGEHRLGARVCPDGKKAREGGDELLRELLKPPALMLARRVLVIQPHPDDAEVAAGGSIAHLVDAGAEVAYVTVTDGSWGTVDPEVEPAALVETRRLEQARAAAILGIVEIAWLDYPDGRAPAGTGPELREHLVRLIRSYQPDCVMAPDPWLSYEAHPDHYNTGLAAAGAVLFAGLAPAHRTPDLSTHSPEMIAFYTTSRPNTYVDIGLTWERKEAALSAHASQFSSPMGELHKALVKVQAKELAARARAGGQLGSSCVLAEAFKVLSALHLHCNWEAENS